MRFLLLINGGVGADPNTDEGADPNTDEGVAKPNTSSSIRTCSSSSSTRINYALLEASLQTLYMLCYPSDLRSLLLAQRGKELVGRGLTSGSPECKRWALWIETVLK